MAAALAIGCGGDDSSTADPAASGGPSTIPQPSQRALAGAGLDELPVASEAERIDIEAPTFSNPTEITNPLFPISDLHSVIFSGRVEGKPFHTETTLLPETRLIEWSDGQEVETRVSQYFAYIDGRIEEVALDYYAQADDGAVWYLGEDVFDYNEEGFVDSFSGTWLAGKEGPAEMIMPGNPQVGDAFRPENIPGVAFEEVRVKTVDKIVNGPTGPVEGAMVARELHDDGTYSDKVFAPGYGEFFSGHGSEVEAMALAIPTDALDGPPPPELGELTAAADKLFEATSAGDWDSANTTERDARAAWDSFRRGQVPPRLAKEMDTAIGELTAGIDARDPALTGNAAIDVAQSTLDLELRHRPPAEIDLARFELFARQILVDAKADNAGGVRADIATLEWVRDRFDDTLDSGDLARIDTHLIELRDSVSFGDEDLAAVTAAAASLRDTLAGL